MIDGVSKYIVGAVIGALLLYVLLPDPPVPEPFQVVQVTPQQMSEVEPDTDRGIGERIATRVVTPTHVAIAQDTALQPQAQAFVDAYVRFTVVEPDSSRRIALPVVPRVALLGYAGRMDDGSLELYAVGSDRTRQRHVFEAGCEPTSWLYDANEVFVQTGRWCWLEDAMVLAGVAGAFYGVGSGSLEFTVAGAAVVAGAKALF